jgi:hypothetical protein
MKNGTLAVWVAFSVVFGLFAGVGAGVLTWLDGHSPAGSILAGFGSCAGGIVLFLGVVLLFQDRSTKARDPSDV